MAEALCYESSSALKQDHEVGYWGALVAAQVLIENRSLEHIVARHRPKVERIRQWLVATLQHGALPPVDRAQAGEALAIIGDPRFRANAWYLPDEPLLGFVEIPSGPFLMGSDQRHDPQAREEEMPQYKLHLARYFIARYPVTVAQFQAFVMDAGSRAEDEPSLRGLPNYPVVNVTWQQALDYCAWLTERLRQWPGTPEPFATLLRRDKWQVLLPSEAEWEKAARGTDARTYPWGDAFELLRTNTIETGVGTISPVGCFPGGASPYGVMELSGNMWEWTRSLWGTDSRLPTYRYPYRWDDGREDLGAPGNTLRVVRGGAFWSDSHLVRCACRGGGGPSLRGSNLGFRVVVRPSS